jgi:hypothetical protein
MTPLGDNDGLYGSKCNISRQCQSGFVCTPYPDVLEGDCEWDGPGSGCCTNTCVINETCDNGLTCAVVWWPAQLEDYLDDYVGIGACATP